MRRVASFGLFPEQVTNHSFLLFFFFFPPFWVCFFSSFTMCATLTHCVFRSFWHRPQPTAVMSDTTWKSKFRSETYRELCVLSLTSFLIWLHEYNRPTQWNTSVSCRGKWLTCDSDLWLDVKPAMWTSLCVKVSVGQQRAHAFFLTDAGRIFKVSELFMCLAASGWTVRICKMTAVTAQMIDLKLI